MSNTSGGRVSVVLGGVAYSARGEIKIMGSGMEVTAGANTDGSVFRTVAARARSVEISFEGNKARFVDANNVPLRWSDEIMLLNDLGLIFQEQDGKNTHIMSGGFFTGTPGNNLATGEVDGIGLAADTYKTIVN